MCLIIPVTVPSGQSPHHVQCTQSKVYNNVKISGGSRAGDFTDVGNVGRMHICTRLCCEEPTCDLAYMVRQSCFLVKCYEEKNCRVIGNIKREKHMNRTTETSVQYIVKRKYDVHFGQGKQGFRAIVAYLRLSHTQTTCSFQNSRPLPNVTNNNSFSKDCANLDDERFRF